jgi:plasmid maintenance system antidote protein VapI
MSRRQIAQRAGVTPSTITRLAREELRLTRATALALLATRSTRQSDSRPARFAAR